MTNSIVLLGRSPSFSDETVLFFKYYLLVDHIKTIVFVKAL